MREIKFRAWMKETKQLIFLTATAFGDLIDNHKKGFEILQSTGLFDKNGKEIFEGDILSQGDNYPCLVIWNKKQCKFEVEEKGNEDGLRYHDMDAYTIPWEIIGNKWENPELMEKKK